MSEVAEGTVKFFHIEKGWGFVVVDATGEEAFVHHRNILMDGFRTLKDGQRVRFEIVETEKGRAARNVVPL